MENQKQFDTWKEQVEGVELKKQIDCLRILELNLSNVCNLKCPFCPQSKNWTTNSPKFMSIETAKEISKQLHSFNFKGYICTAGMGEPSLNKEWVEILEQLKDFNLVVVTNGSFPDRDTWKRVSEIAQIKVSVHDWKNIEAYKNKFLGTNAWFRNHDTEKPQMNLYNRGGYLWDAEEKTTRMCHFPFYKLFIDTDGSYLRCEADWSHKSKNQFNIFNMPIDKYFVEIMEKDRKMMNDSQGRQNFESCKNCDINGILTGLKFVEFWRNINEG